MKPALIASSMTFACALFAASPAFAEPTTDTTPTSDDGRTVIMNDQPAAARSTPATASAPVSEDRSEPEGTPRYDLIRVNAGLKIGYVSSSGFDPYASNDVLPQFSIDATYPVLVRGKLALGVGLGWDTGGRSGTMRGFDTSIGVHRLYVPIEGRYHFKPWLYGFGKISPGAAAMSATVNDTTTPDKLSATGWAFSADASIGASILLAPRKHLDTRKIHFWATPEIGYAFTTKAPLNVNAGRDDKDVLGSDENTNLRSLALNGLFWRASVGATF